MSPPPSVSMLPWTSVLRTLSSPTIWKATLVRILFPPAPQLPIVLPVWVNNYHLMFLPALLRANPQLPAHVPIGFFMHVVFPSSEIFRCLSARDKDLCGLLVADLIGFQTASYTHHFRQTVSRILVCEALPKGIGGRFVDVGVFPMGIDTQALREKRCVLLIQAAQLRC